MEGVFVRMPGSLGWTPVLDLCDPFSLHYIHETYSNFKDHTYFFLSLCFFFFLRDNRGASVRFSPPLSALGASKRFSPKDLLSKFFIFCETTGVPPWGFHPYCLPWPPQRGFRLGIFFSFSFDDQGVVGTEAKTCPITIIDFSTVSMNSYLKGVSCRFSIDAHWWAWEWPLHQWS